MCANGHGVHSHGSAYRMPARRGTAPLPGDDGACMALAWLRFPYTTPELDLLFRVAHAEDLERGGRYEAHRAAISLWTSPWPPKWRASSYLVANKMPPR